MDTLLQLNSIEPLAKELTEKAAMLLTTFEGTDMTVGEIDWMLEKARSLLAFSTFQGTDYPDALNVWGK